ncbi:putative zinc-binding metallopeptidase, partial [Helicobacter bizzozeronii]|uniref:putative zinc-binding metallopeptidase n=1 Tax=Helicobacter bizzozeronii TaxID=56877 RepID=UPI0025570B07
PASGGGPVLCRSGSLTRTRPADDDGEGRARFTEAEAAKRRLVAQLLDLGLPVVGFDDADDGLGFDLLSSHFDQVVTGHEDGIVTVDLAEADDAHRERVRHELGEAYRTVLGHFRHEVGHYYWTVLVRGTDALDGFRAVFGDERADYGQAMGSHYGGGPPVGWEATHVSAYATMHPWEDWAETFAHLLHLRDTLQTAAESGVTVVDPDGAASAPASATDDFDVIV